MLITKRNDVIINGREISYDYDKESTGPHFQASDTVPSGYSDFSSIENWHLYGYETGKDYKVIRSEIKSLYQSIQWVNLSTTEKTICANYFIPPKIERDEVYTTEQQIMLGLLFHSNSIDARKTRYAYAAMEVYNRLTKVESEEVINDVVSNNLVEKYISNGVEGTLEGDEEGIFDYVESVTGTSYQSSGLATKSYIPDGMSLTQLIDRIMEILRDGKY